MQPNAIELRVPCLPDPEATSNRLRAGGDVRAAIWEDAEHLARALAAFPPGSAAVRIRFCYVPAANGQDVRQRLSIFLTGQAHQLEVTPGLSALLNRGPLVRFYRLSVQEGEIPAPWSQFHAACDVLRPQAILKPTVPPELNACALPAYYTIEPFTPRRDNDYLRLDSILSSLEEPVLLEICVEPAETSQELDQHTRNLTRLQRINRSWEPDEDALAEEGWGDRGADPDLRSRSLTPLKDKDPLADEVLRKAQRFHETLLRPHLRFHIRAFASCPATARFAASVAAESAFAEGSYQLFDSVRGDGFLDSALQQCRLARVVSPPVLRRLMRQRDLHLYDGLDRLGSLATVDELTGAFRLPVASHASPCCMRKDTDPPAVDPRELIVLGYDSELAADEPKDASHRVLRGVRVDCLTKGLFAVGMPGQGKTTAMLAILVQLARRGIPFLALEPAKTEYRILKCLTNHPDPEVRQWAKELQLYTPGNEAISPFRLNPLVVPAGITLDEHIENILTCFKAAVPLTGPMPMILTEGLEQLYDDHPEGPRMAELFSATQRVLAAKGYSAELDSDLRAALGVRVGSLARGAIGRVFQCGQDIPLISSLLTGSSVIELAGLPPEQASLLTLFILTRIAEEIRATPWSGRGVRFVLCLEEAHNLVGPKRDSSANEDNADPKAHASDFICRMLVEFRALGVGTMIVDQFSSAVAPEVSKSTASKLAFRQVDKDEREQVGGMMLCGPVEEDDLARLSTGEGFLFTEGYASPRRIRTPHLHAELGLPPLPTHEAILPYLADDSWFIKAAMVRFMSEMNQLCDDMDRFEHARMQALGEMKTLIRERLAILARGSPSGRLRELAVLCKRARALRSHLSDTFTSFCRRTYRPVMSGWSGKAHLNEDARSLREGLARRFEAVVSSDTRADLHRLDQFIRSCEGRPSG